MFKIRICDLWVEYLKDAPIPEQHLAVSPLEQFLLLCSNLNLEVLLEPNQWKHHYLIAF